MRTLCSVLFLVLLASCNSGSNGTRAPDSVSALSPIATEQRRIGIVYSDTSASRYYDLFVYNQIFAAMQQLARQAGLPYDLLTETDMTDAAKLASYDAIVMPAFTHAPAVSRNAIVAALASAQQTGTGIVAAADLLAVDERGRSFADWDAPMRDLLGIEPTVYIEGEPTLVRIVETNHPITSGYTLNEEIADYPQAWYADYRPADGSSHTVLATATANGETYAAMAATDNVARVVHFATDELMTDNLLWHALQWVVYGERAPVSLQMSRFDSIVAARNDMDQTMFPALLDTTHVPLLGILEDWKRDYNFTGSHYIDIGNDPANGQFTDWTVSAPLLQQYMDLGIEIGTHSWTHPYFTANLSDAQIEFEFNQSRIEISSQLNSTVTGGAIPGNTESLRVVENLNQWFEYFSGKANPFKLTQPAAIGFLRPDHDMIYFSLNTSPDFTLSDYLNYPPDLAEQVWREEFDAILTPHARQPVIHWLWHDYAPTTGIADGTYTREMFDNTVAYLYQKGVEFATLDDIQKRIRRFSAAEVSIGASATIEAIVQGSDLGRFSLQLAPGQTIKNVADWYAYSDDKVFLPDDGGQFNIASGASADPVTRISHLPMRARLLDVTGDGATLSFRFSGSGQATVTLNPQLVGNYVVSGADSIIERDDQLLLTFNTEATHSVAINYNIAPNVAPVAIDQSLSTTSDEALNIALTATDADNQTLQFTIVAAPQNGVLSGSAPELVYLPNGDFAGTDSFTFTASDGIDISNVATITVNVSETPVPNRAPIANAIALQTVADNGIDLVLSGSDNEGQTLTYDLLSSPANGVLSGDAPAIRYTPASGFIGLDQFSYSVSDGSASSEPATVSINVVSQLPPANGTRSNPLSDMQIDGDLTEWSAATSFGADSVDANGPNDLIDWQQAWFGHDDSHLYIAYQTVQPTTLSWGHGVYLDTDTSRLTGFRGFGDELSIGADYLVEGANLFRYAARGDGTSWNWEFVASVTSATVANTSEFVIALADLGARDQGAPVNLRVVFRGNSFATGGSALDDYPNDAANAAAVNAQRHFSYSVNANVQIDNIAPDANPQSLTLVSGTAVQLMLTGSDLNSDGLTYAILSQPSNGSLSGQAPAIVYTPDAQFAGIDSFTFSVSDGSLQSNPATVLLDVVSPPAENVAPIANSQTLAVLNTASISVALTASDANGDALTFELIEQPQNGSLSGTAPNLVYTPQPSFSGVDTFSFRAADAALSSNPATISILVGNIVENSAPVANSAALVTSFETAISAALTASDADDHPLSYRIIDQPRLGMLSGTAPALTYTPFNGVSGADFFTFSVNDGSADSNIATIDIEVLAQNQPNLPPVAIGLNLSAEPNQSVAVTLAGRDPEGADLSYEIVALPQRGSLQGVAPQLVYEPNVDSTGLDSFSYRVNDGALQSGVISVTVDIGETDPTPVSNAVSGIVIDGAIGDWHGLRSTGIDADDIFGPENPLDMRASWIAHDDDNFYFALRNDGPFMLSWGSQWFVDTDGDNGTGFTGFSGGYPLGADFLIEGTSIHRYTGSGGNWSWRYQGTIDVAIVGDTLEMSIARSALGNATDLELFMIANSAAFGGVAVDYFPQAVLDTSQPAAARLIRYSSGQLQGSQETSASYRATFNSTWSADTHPTNFPSADPHFSGLVGAVHNEQLSLWAVGEQASDGIEQVAETGASAILLAQVQAAIDAGTALAQISGDGIALSPGNVAIEFSVQRDYPLVTLISMLAPSPDWFVGVSGQSMLAGNGEFIDRLSVDLRLYDSGSDDGASFLAADQASEPPVPIAPLTSSAADTDFVDGLPIIGQLVIERVLQQDSAASR